mmetsp:Transcript_39157/g.55119  ORF Transcript_39157/g.55119 Transcript_39157/m.55119 type:complete len:103 (+) Transcript_39157:34-342(+)
MTIDLKDFYLNTIHWYHLQKGMYSLPQAGYIRYEQLKKFLTPHGYHKCNIMPRLWKYATRPIQFCLVVDDFGVKYTNKDNTHHLINIPFPTSTPNLTTRLST